MSIVIFTSHGNTFTFRNTEIVSDNESVLQFRYIAMSDSKQKVATFLKKCIVGWSIYD